MANGKKEIQKKKLLYTVGGNINWILGVRNAAEMSPKDLEYDINLVVTAAPALEMAPILNVPLGTKYCQTLYATEIQ